MMNHHMSSKIMLKNHPYDTERVTPVSEIPAEFQLKAILPGGRFQIIDTRLCYNWQPGENGGRYVECGSVAADAGKLLKEHEH